MMSDFVHQSKSYLVKGFVEGHGFSRAVNAINDAGFSP